MYPASWATLSDPRRRESNPRKHQSCRGWARFQDEVESNEWSAHTCFPRKVDTGRQRCPIDERRVQRVRAGAPDLPCPGGFNPGRLSPLKRHGDESWVQFACGTGGSGGRGKVCGPGSDGQRRQDHLGEGPTEEVPPARAAKRSGPTDQWPRLCGADYEIVKVPAHLESTRLLDPADLHRLEAGRSDQPLDF